MSSVRRRDFLKSAGIAAAGIGLWPELAAQEAAPDKSVLDGLLENYRKHQRTGLYAGSPGGGNHIPMTLIAAHRLGAGADELKRYAGKFKLRPEAKPIDTSGMARPNRENWREHLGRGGFLPFVEYFEDRVNRTSLEAVLKEHLPVLASGMGGAFSHDLIRLAYGLDIESREEVVFSLAGWAGQYQPNPDYDQKAAAVEPEALLEDIVRKASGLAIQRDGGNFGPIAFRLEQVYAAREFRSALKPVRVPDADPLARMSEIIVDTFSRTQDFTLLHTFTTCQALRLALPYLADPRPSLSAFWHSMCAAYLTVAKFKPGIGKDSVAESRQEWKDVHAQARATSLQWASVYEHTVKLTYSCWLEAGHYKRDRYVGVAAREVKSPSRFT